MPPGEGAPAVWAPPRATRSQKRHRGHGEGRAEKARQERKEEQGKPRAVTDKKEPTGNSEAD